MNTTKLRIGSIIIFIVGLLFLLVGLNIFAKMNVVHPDGVITVHNNTTNKNTQAYAVGKMQIYIDETYRMDMPLWSFYVKTQGENNNETFNALNEGNENLSLIKDNSDYNPNPFILKLKIKNISKAPIYLNYKNFKIRDVQGNIYAPHDEWQKVMSEAGMFAGTNKNNQINPNEEKVLWLLFATPSQEIKDASAYQEYVRINYDSDSDLMATKIEFPFNYTTDYPIGDYQEITNNAYSKGLIAILLWTSICILGYYKLKEKNLE